MNLKKEFNRLSGMFGDRYSDMQETNDDYRHRMRKEAGALADRARRGLEQSRDTLMSAEEMIERHMRQNSMMYLIAGLLLLVGFALLRTTATQYRSMPESEW